MGCIFFIGILRSRRIDDTLHILGNLEPFVHFMTDFINNLLVWFSLREDEEMRKERLYFWRT